MVESKGHVNPGDPDVRLARFRLGPGLSDLVRHVWVGRWDLPPGDERTQLSLTYPGCNAVITAEEARLYGPAPRVAHRTLAGSGWVVGVLLRPAATTVMGRLPPRELVGVHEPLRGAPVRRIRQAMEQDDDHSDVAAALEEWLCPMAAQVTASGRLANEVCRLAEEDAAILTVQELAARVDTSERALHRLLGSQVGVTAKWLLERRRLQDAATALTQQPDLPLAALAAQLGYADQAHFHKRFAQTVGWTPAQLRQQARKL